MRVFKASYKDRKGKARESSKWYVEFRDHLETVRRLPAFTDKKQSETAGRNVEKLVACKINGDPPDKELGRWLEALPKAMRDKLCGIGLLDATSAAAGKKLVEHLDAFRAALVAKNNTPEYVRLTLTRVQSLFDGCGFRAWNDIDGAAVEAWLAAEREAGRLSIQTSNFYVGSAKQFCKWMVKARRASQSPLEHLGKLNVATDRKHDRRELSADECRRLLAVAYIGPERYGVPGAERRLLYLLALQSGIRANELRSLTRSSFDFRPNPATVTVEAGSSKRRRRDTLPLRADTAAELQRHLAAKHPGTAAFSLPAKYDMADMLKADLEAARAAWLDEACTVEQKAMREQTTFLAYVDDAGGFADFHALRHTFISTLARSGVHPKVAQALARHSTITLTMDRYSHTVLGEQSEAVEALPSLAAATVDALRATGTDDATDGGNSVLASSLAERGAVKTASVGPASNAQDPGDSGTDSVLASCLALERRKLCSNPTFEEPILATAENEKNPRKHAGFEGLDAVRLAGFGPATYGLGNRKDNPTTTEAASTCDNAAERLGVLLGALPAKLDGLAAVVEAWPDLPEPIRLAILAMVDAAR